MINGIEPEVNPMIERLVVVARVALKLVIVPSVEVRTEVEALVMVVVAKLVVPVTTNVLVVVLFSTVRLLINAVAAFNRVAKKLVEVEFVEELFSEKKEVNVPVAAPKRSVEKLVE